MDYYPITPQAYAAAMQGHLPMMEALPAEYYAALHAQAAAPNPAYYSHYMNSMMKGYSPAELAALQNQMNPYYAAQQAKLPGATKYRDLTDLPYSSVAVPPVPHYPHDPSLGLNSLRMKPTPAMGKDSFEPNGVMLSQGLKSNLALGLGLESALMSEARFKNAMSVEQAKALLAEEELKRTRKYPMSYDGITNPLYMSTVPANKPSIVKDLKESKVKVEPLQVPAKEDSANDKEASDLLINFFKTAQSRDSLPEMLNEAKKAALVASSAESTEISSPVTDTEELIASSSDSSYIGKSGSEKSFEPSTSQSRRSLISLNDSSHDQFILSCQPPTQFLSTIDPAMLISNKRKLDANNSSLEEMQKKVKV